LDGVFCFCIGGEQKLSFRWIHLIIFVFFWQVAFFSREKKTETLKLGNLETCSFIALMNNNNKNIEEAAAKGWRQPFTSQPKVASQQPLVASQQPLVASPTARAVLGNFARPTINFAPEDKQRDLMLCMDMREGANKPLYDAVKGKMAAMGIAHKLKVMKLELFDFQYVFENDEKKLFGPLIERKTASDLAGGIKNGHFREQRGRANALGIPGSKKIYIYEGHLLDRNYRIDPKSLIGATIKPVMNDEYNVTLTQNMQATADDLIMWLLYLEHLTDKPTIKHYEYTDYIQPSARKRDFRKNHRLPMMIREYVFGASSAISTAIANKFTTMARLQDAFIFHERDTRVTISRLLYDCGDKKRYIGQAVTQELYEFLEIDSLRTQLRSEMATRVAGTGKYTTSEMKTMLTDLIPQPMDMSELTKIRKSSQKAKDMFHLGRKASPSTRKAKASTSGSGSDFSDISGSDMSDEYEEEEDEDEEQKAAPSSTTTATTTKHINKKVKFDNEPHGFDNEGDDTLDDDFWTNTNVLDELDQIEAKAQAKA
jgi:ERCC4-type nuclease